MAGQVRGIVVVAAAGLGLAIGSSPAAALVTVGATDAEFAEADAGYACKHPDCGMWQSTAPLGHTTTAPADGVIVRWRMRIFDVIRDPTRPDPTVIPRLVGPAASPLPWGAAGPVISLPTGGYPRTITTPMRMPIAAGQGLAVEIPQPAIDPANPSQFVAFAVIDEDEAGNCRLITPAPAPGASGDGFECATEYNLLAIAADVEADADRDGFGDETQDACPSDASTQGPCPPARTGDQEGPTLSWCGAGRQALRASRVVRICIGSDELAAIEATASLRRAGGRGSVELGPASAAASATAPARLELGLSRRARDLLERAHDSGKTARATLTVVGTDAAGNRSTLTAIVSARR